MKYKKPNNKVRKNTLLTRKKEKERMHGQAYYDYVKINFVRQI